MQQPLSTKPEQKSPISYSTISDDEKRLLLIICAALNSKDVAKREMSVKPILGFASALLNLSKTRSARSSAELEAAREEANTSGPPAPGSRVLEEEEMNMNSRSLVRQNRSRLTSPSHFPERLTEDYIERSPAPRDANRPSSAMSYSNSMSVFDEEAGYAGRAFMESPSCRVLEEGALVVMLTRDNDLVFTQQIGKVWELQATQTRHPSGVQSAKLRFYPYGCLFIVLRKGKYVGFRALGAEGRTVQAVAEEDGPHRVNNHNFGHWEMWELTAEGYVNRKWPHKVLGYDVKEIAAVSMEDIQNLEVHSSMAVRRALSQLKISERKNKELMRQKQRSSTQHQQDLTEIKNRLQESLREKQRLEVDSVRIGARLKNLELQNQHLNMHIENAESAQRRSELDSKELSSQIQIIKEKYEDAIRHLGRQHDDTEKLSTRTNDTYKNTENDKELVELRRELEIIRQQRDSESHKLRQKAQDFNQLMAEHRRLQNAFQSVKSQVEQLNVVKAQIDAFSHRLTMEDCLPMSSSPMMNSGLLHSRPMSPSLHMRSGLLSSRSDIFRSDISLKKSASIGGNELEEDWRDEPLQQQYRHRVSLHHQHQPSMTGFEEEKEEEGEGQEEGDERKSDCGEEPNPENGSTTELNKHPKNSRVKYFET